MSIAAHVELPERIAGRYEIVGPELAASETAIVHQAIDHADGRSVAIKFLVELAKEDVRRRFAREVEIHSTLEHPGIVRFLDHGAAGKHPYIVTELMPGGSLRARVGKPALPLAREDVALIANRLLDALAYLHSTACVIHGDVSSGNVLLRSDGQAALADFGISKWLHGGEVTTGDGWHTPGYRGVLRHGEPKDLIDDVEGAAAVLWFALTGVRADQRERLAPAPPDPWREPLERALASEIGTIRELRAALPLPVDWAEEASQPEPRRRRWTGVAVAAAGMTGLGAAAAFGQMAAPSATPPTRQTVTSDTLQARLPSDWSPAHARAIPGLVLSGAVAATSAGVRIDAGIASPGGAQLVPHDALEALPAPLRTPQEVVVGGHQALRFGPAPAQTETASELVAFPLREQVLVVSCSGPAARLVERCAGAIETLRPRDEHFAGLRADEAASAAIRTAVSTLDDVRAAQRGTLAASESASTRQAAAKDLAVAYRRFAHTLSKVDPGVRAAGSLDTVAGAAHRLDVEYTRLATVVRAPKPWRAATDRIKAREAALRAALTKLGEVGLRR